MTLTYIFKSVLHTMIRVLGLYKRCDATGDCCTTLSFFIWQFCCRPRKRSYYRWATAIFVNGNLDLHFQDHMIRHFCSRHHCGRNWSNDSRDISKIERFLELYALQKLDFFCKCCHLLTFYLLPSWLTALLTYCHSKDYRLTALLPYLLTAIVKTIDLLPYWLTALLTYCHSKDYRLNSLLTYCHSKDYRLTASMTYCHSKDYRLTASLTYCHSKDYRLTALLTYCHSIDYILTVLLT